jgi:hypothetical protein
VATTSGITDKAPSYSERYPQWRRVRDALEGEEVIKDRGSEYLPKPEGQNLKQYKAYRTRASFYAVTERTLRGLVGLIFRIEPTVISPGLEPFLVSATPHGFPVVSVIRNAVKEILSLGRYGVLVDFPEGPSATALPYLSEYTAENIFRWEENMVGGRRFLSRVVVHDDEHFTGATEVRRVRELLLDPVDGFYKVRLWEKMELHGGGPGRGTGSRAEELDEPIEGGGFVMIEERVPLVRQRPLTRIPFHFINTYDLNPEPCKPPMLDLTNMNLAHYRNSADYEHAMFHATQPARWAAGRAGSIEPPTTVGPNTFWIFPEGTTVGILEYSGRGIEDLRQAMQDKEQRMAALGARLIQDPDRGNVTAETTRLRTRGETSILLATVQTVEEAFLPILQDVGRWLGLSDSALEEIDISLNRDFIETRLGSQDVMALVGAWQAGAISRDSLHNILQRGEIIDAKRSVEEETELIESAPPPAAPGAAETPAEEGENAEAEEEDDAGPMAPNQIWVGRTSEDSGTTSGPHHHVFAVVVAPGDARTSGFTGRAEGHRHAVRAGENGSIEILEADGHTHEPEGAKMIQLEGTVPPVQTQGQ